MGKVVPAGAATRAARTASAEARRGVAVFGDSLTLQAWAYVQRIASDRGQPFDGGAYGGTALCDWLGGIHKVLTRDHPTALVLAFAGNNLTPCTLTPSGKRRFGADLVTRYRAVTQRAIADAARAHTKVFLVGPAAMRDPVWNHHATRLRTMLRTLAQLHRWSPLVPVFGDGRFPTQPVWIEDVALAFALAAERPASGGVFELGGPAALTYEEFVRAIGRAAGHPRPLVHVPLPVTRAVAAAFGVAGPLAPLTTDQLQMLVEGSATPANALESLFGIRALPFEAGLARYLGGGRRR